MICSQVIWDGFPPDAATWEPPSEISDDLIEDYEDCLDDEAAADAELDDDDDDDDDHNEADEVPAADADSSDEDELEEEISLVHVSKIVAHYVSHGARVGSLANIFVRVEYTDGTNSARDYVPCEPLGESEAGRAVLARYLKCKAGGKIAKYVPVP